MLIDQDLETTTLVTDYATFNVKVYVADDGKEHVLLWTPNLDLGQPVLARVHSECLTGDVLGSKHCDCGQQLRAALKSIGNSGGILMYLRQEGRGIGLFEKMKAYKLQSKGMDTFDANVSLGHKPDAREYSLVKKMLDDISVCSIDLLTNNPSKVNELRALGILVNKRIPLVIQPNEISEKYLHTKQVKFQHHLGSHEYIPTLQFQTNDCTNAANVLDKVKKRIETSHAIIGVGLCCTPSSIIQPDFKFLLQEFN